MGGVLNILERFVRRSCWLKCTGAMPAHRGPKEGILVRFTSIGYMNSKSLSHLQHQLSVRYISTETLRLDSKVGGASRFTSRHFGYEIVVK